MADAEHAVACANIIGGDEDSGIAHLTRLEREAAEQGRIARQSWLAVNLGSGCGEVKRYEQSVSWLETAEGLAARVDMDQTGAYAAAWLARVAFERGQRIRRESHGHGLRVRSIEPHRRRPARRPYPGPAHRSSGPPVLRVIVTFRGFSAGER